MRKGKRSIRHRNRERKKGAAHTYHREIFQKIADAISTSMETCNWFAVNRRLNVEMFARAHVHYDGNRRERAICVVRLA